MRHAAPEVSPHKKTWTIYASERIHQIAIELCAKGDIETLAANIIYRALTAIDCQDPQEASRRRESFRLDIFTACSNLFEVHHVQSGAEVFFGIFNKQTLKAISPDMKSNRRKLLRVLVLGAVEEWVNLQRESFSRIDPHGLFEVVGPAAFMKLIPRLHLNVRVLPAEDLEVLFYHLNTEARDMFGTIRIAVSILPVDHLESPLNGTSWTLRRVLRMIENRQSEHALRFFLSHLEDRALLLEALKALRERDVDTGLLREKWSYAASLRLEADLDSGSQILPKMPNLWPMVEAQPQENVNKLVAAIDLDLEIPRGQQIRLTDGEMRPVKFSRRVPLPLSTAVGPSRLRDVPWPQLAFDPQDAMTTDHDHGHEVLGTTAANAYDALSGRAEGISNIDFWGGGSVTEQRKQTSSIPGLPAPDATLPVDRIHFIDSVQSLSHVITFLQHAPPEFVGVDLEWSDPVPISAIQIATQSRAFVIDCVNRTPLYMSVLHCLMDWLLKREETTKLFFGFPHDLIRLNMLFEPSGKLFEGHVAIASVVDLYMQRLRRVQVKVPRHEETLLGREELFGDALQQEDLEEVNRLGRDVPPHPPRETLAEKVYTVGGHHSLASMSKRYLGEVLNKEYQTSNWNFRPLAAGQVVYAATDAHVLLRIESAMRELDIFPQRVFGVGPRDVKHQPAWWKDSQLTA